MKLWSTCNDCGESMLVYEQFPEFQNRHPLCKDKPDRLQLLDREMQQAIRDEDWDRLELLGRRANDHMNRHIEHVETALLYASWGWPVFPLRPGAKTPITRHGFKEAVTDPVQIRKWWAATPTANVGVATGHAFDVIDVDVPDGIAYWLHLQERTDPILEVHGWVHTPSGGFHVLIEPTGDGNTTAAAPGVDYRGLGGYVVAPPSFLHLAENGEKGQGRYRWSMKPSPVIKPGLVRA